MVVQKYFSALEKNVGWGGGVMPRYFMNVKNVVGGGGCWVNIFYGPDIMLRGGGGWAGGYAKIFDGLENITRPANYMQLTCSMSEKSMV